MISKILYFIILVGVVSVSSQYEEIVAAKSNEFSNVILKAPKPSESVLRTAAGVLARVRELRAKGAETPRLRRLVEEPSGEHEQVDYFIVGHMYSSPADCDSNQGKIMSMAFPSYHGEDCSLIDPATPSAGSVATVGCLHPSESQSGGSLGSTHPESEIAVEYGVFDSQDCSGPVLDIFSEIIMQFPPRCQQTNVDGRPIPIMHVRCRNRSNPPFRGKGSLTLDRYENEEDCLDGRMPSRRLMFHPEHCLDGVLLARCDGKSVLLSFQS